MHQKDRKFTAKLTPQNGTLVLISCRQNELGNKTLKEIKIFLSNPMIDERQRVDHKIVQSRDYQLALKIPGMRPWLAISRKQIRESLNFLKQPLARPVS